MVIAKVPAIAWPGTQVAINIVIDKGEVTPRYLAHVMGCTLEHARKKIQVAVDEKVLAWQDENTATLPLDEEKEE